MDQSTLASFNEFLMIVVYFAIGIKNKSLNTPEYISEVDGCSIDEQLAGTLIHF